MWLGNVQNTARVNQSRYCAIAEILWSRSSLPEISNLKKKSETATLSQLSRVQSCDVDRPPIPWSGLWRRSSTHPMVRLVTFIVHPSHGQACDVYRPPIPWSGLWRRSSTHPMVSSLSVNCTILIVYRITREASSVSNIMVRKSELV